MQFLSLSILSIFQFKCKLILKVTALERKDPIRSQCILSCHFYYCLINVLFVLILSIEITAISWENLLNVIVSEVILYNINIGTYKPIFVVTFFLFPLDLTYNFHLLLLISCYFVVSVSVHSNWCLSLQFYSSRYFVLHIFHCLCHFVFTVFIIVSFFLFSSHFPLVVVIVSTSKQFLGNLLCSYFFHIKSTSPLTCFCSNHFRFVETSLFYSFLVPFVTNVSILLIFYSFSFLFVDFIMINVFILISHQLLLLLS